MNLIGWSNCTLRRLRATIREVVEQLKAIDPILQSASALSQMVDFLAGGVFLMLKRWILEDRARASDALGELVDEAGLALRAILDSDHDRSK